MRVKLYRWLEELVTLCDSPAIRELNSRATQSDAEFYREFYAGSGVTHDTCARVRHVLCRQLRRRNTGPSDNVAALLPDLDIAEVCYEIGEDFGVPFPEDTMANLNGTVDSLILATQKLVDSTHSR